MALYMANLLIGLMSLPRQDDHVSRRVVLDGPLDRLFPVRDHGIAVSLYLHTGEDIVNDRLRRLRAGVVGGDDGKIGTELSDFAIITSDNPRTEPPEAIIDDILAGVEVKKNRYAVIPDREKAIAWAIGHHAPGDVIVLAGKGHETYQEIGHEKRHMDEREIVAEILEKRKNQ